jgi:hypothetical protein
MWDERISVVRAFADAITARDLEAALERKLWRQTLYRDPDEALRQLG